MLRRFALSGFLVIACVASVAAVAAEVPYATLHGVLGAVKSVTPYKQLRAVQRIESKSADVAPSAIRLSIRTAAGEVAVPIAADGQLDFPLSPELLAENPVVVTNQPAGSLTLSVSIELPPPDRAEWPAAEVREALDQAEAFFTASPGHDGRRVRGVEFRFAAGEGSVTVRGDTERLLVPDADGRVLLMRDTDLADAREVALGAKPVRVLPFLEH
jgi:hypothetical protein